MSKDLGEKILSLNKLAMECLRKNDTKKAQDYLAKAQGLLNKAHCQNFYHLSAVTRNNLGCLHKRLGNQALALNHLFAALEDEESHNQDPLNLAGIHLNISSILSLQLQHKDSLDHCLLAKRILLKTPERDQNIWISLIISYHCTGFEFQALYMLEEARECYLKGWELSQDHLGPFHKVTEGIKKSYLALQHSAQPRSKTPTLTSKCSSISIASNINKGRNISRGQNSKRKIFKIIEPGKQKSISSFGTLDLLVNELENGVYRSDNTTDSHIKLKPGSSLEVAKGVTKKPKKTELPRVSEKKQNLSSRRSASKSSHQAKRAEDGLQEIRKQHKQEIMWKHDEEFSALRRLNSESQNSSESFQARFKQIIAQGQSEGSVAEQSKESNLISNCFFDEVEDDSDSEAKNSKKSIEKITKFSEDEIISIDEEVENLKTDHKSGVKNEVEPEFNQESSNEKHCEDISVQTEACIKINVCTQTSAKDNRLFRSVAATIIQREWRKYKGTRDPIYWKYIREINEAYKGAQLAIAKVQSLEKELESKRIPIGGIPVPQKRKLLAEKDNTSDNALMKLNIHQLLFKRPINP